MGFKDLDHRSEGSDHYLGEAKSWVASGADTPSVSWGLETEVWTHQAWARHIRSQTRDTGSRIHGPADSERTGTQAPQGPV